MTRDYILKSLVEDTITQLKHDPGGIYNKEILAEQFNRALDIGTNYLKFEQKAQKKSKPVIQINKFGKVIDEFSSVRQAAEETGICRTSIAKACREEQNTAGKYHWKYKLK